MHSRTTRHLRTERSAHTRACDNIHTTTLQTRIIAHDHTSTHLSTCKSSCTRRYSTCSGAPRFRNTNTNELMWRRPSPPLPLCLAHLSECSKNEHTVAIMLCSTIHFIRLNLLTLRSAQDGKQIKSEAKNGVVSPLIWVLTSSFLQLPAMPVQGGGGGKEGVDPRTSTIAHSHFCLPHMLCLT